MKEASNRPIPVQAENGTSPSPSPVGGAVRQPGTLYGYVRTSRQQLEGAAGMNPETQARALEAAGVCPSDLYRDLGLSGTTASTSRAGWRALQGRLRPGDTVVVVELARIFFGGPEGRGVSQGRQGHHRGATARVGPAHRVVRRPGPVRADTGGLGGDRTGESQVGGRAQASRSRETRFPGQASNPPWTGGAGRDRRGRGGATAAGDAAAVLREPVGAGRLTAATGGGRRNSDGLPPAQLCMRPFCVSGSTACPRNPQPRTCSIGRLPLSMSRAARR